jgi:hypothetical protein
VWKLFGVEYSAYTGSVEGTFIAISRIMAKYPGQWGWWPFWNCGMPFETSYLPFSHWLVAGFVLLTGIAAPHAFHIVTAAIYASSALALFWMALVLSRKPVASFVAALGYSCFSFCNLLIPQIRADSGGIWNLRRLQVLVYFGESPHTLALALTPVAVVCFHHALTRSGVRWKILAGVATAMVVLSNAFGLVTLGTALVCWMLAFRVRRWWMVAAIGALSYCWISPWLSPAMIRAIRVSAPTAGGDFRYHAASWIALLAMLAGFAALWLLLRKAAAHVQFFVLFGYIHTAIVVLWYAAGVSIVAQPWRSQLEMDMALLLAVVFGVAAIVERFPATVRRAAAAMLLAGLAGLTVHAALYSRTLIRAADPMTLSDYRLAKWMDANHPGERAFLGGDASLLYNAVTDNPQLKGGHDQHAVNPFILIVAYTLYSDMNAGDRAAGYSIFWLKAYGARMVSVPGPDSDDYYKPFAHPGKFDGVLPVLWREGGQTVYEVPGRTNSLAHVIPAAAVVARTPLHGLDIAPAEAYVAALDDPRLPRATFVWNGMSEAAIHAAVAPGQVVAAQITYDRGWEAWSSGRRLSTRRDGLGLMVIDGCAGECEIALRYTGGSERTVTRALSLMASLAAVGLVVARLRR